jgi:hypothetical protein
MPRDPIRRVGERLLEQERGQQGFRGIAQQIGAANRAALAQLACDLIDRKDHREPLAVPRQRIDVAVAVGEMIIGRDPIGLGRETDRVPVMPAHGIDGRGDPAETARIGLRPHDLDRGDQIDDREHRRDRRRHDPAQPPPDAEGEESHGDDKDEVDHGALGIIGKRQREDGHRHRPKHRLVPRRVRTVSD